jgi:GT2 family glycosyltransferase
MPTSLKNNHHVTAIVVSHDGALWLPEVVASLSKQKHAIDQLVAVDTGSTDGSAKLLKGAGIPVISARRDCGFGEAVKLALESKKLSAANDDVHEWIWLIHDDCAPSATALGELLSAVDERPNVAMAGPKLRGWHDRNHLLEVGVSIAGNGARWTGLEYREQDQGQHDEIKEVLSVSTAGALIRRDVFEEINGFDPDLTLFRDDVDFGWRVHTAGHSVIVVPQAIAFHAEAASNERRSVDVDHNFFRRPLLLDRRNAAYVLMVNSSLWLTPLIALQLFTSALFRSFGFLLAKLPGYALDEIAAVFLILARPQVLLRARAKRRATRLVSSRVVARFIPPRTSQFQLALERSRSVLARAWNSSALASRDDSRVQSSALDLNDEALESADIELVKTPSFASVVSRRPILTASILITFFSLLAFRGRLGDLVGGALPVVPESGMDLLRSYADSWHTVGLGSSANMPPWVALLGIASIITFFNLKLFVSLLFISAIPLAFLGAYRLARRFTELHFLALLAALFYAFSPVAIASINSGRLATVLLIVIGPWFIRSLLGLELLESLNWRKIWVLALILTVIASFSPLTGVAILLWQGILLITDLVSFNSPNPKMTKEDFDQKNVRRLALLITPIILSAPWSLEFLLHPSRIFLDPGLNVSGGNVPSIIIGNPGGIGSLPIWIVSPILLISIIALFVSKTSRLGEVALFFLGLAAIFGSREVSGHGIFTPERLWVGSLLIIPTLAAMIAAVIIVDQYVPAISQAHVDYRHILLGLVSALTSFAVVMSMLWWVASATNAPLQARKNSALPAFLSASAQTVDRFKTLVLRNSETGVRYFIARDRDLHLGEPDVMTGLSPVVTKAINEIVSGVGVTSSQVLAEFGIRYVFLARPFDEDLVRTIDGLGGFTRSSATDEGISWKVSGALGHIAFLSSDGQYTSLPSGRIGAEGTFTSAGTLLITEKFDGRWKMVLNGRLVKAEETENGISRFTVSEPGEFLLYHDGTTRRGWISLQIITFSTVIILALPARRRRSQMREEELA